MIYKLIVLITIIGSVSSLDLSPLSSSQISQYLMESRKVGGRSGCVRFGVVVMHELGQTEEVGDHPKETQHINDIVSTLFANLNDSEIRHSIKLKDPLDAKLETFVHQCIVYLGSDEILKKKINNETADVKSSDSSDQVSDEQSVISDISDAPSFVSDDDASSDSESSETSVSESGSESESESEPELESELESTIVPETSQEETTAQTKPKVPTDLPNWPLKPNDDQKRKVDLISMRAKHGLNVKMSKQNQVDEKMSIEERLNKSGLSIRSKHQPELMAKLTANIETAPSIEKLRMDIEKANRRLGVNGNLMNPHKANIASSL